MRRKYVFLLGILLLALALRCIALGQRSIQYDDAFSFFLAERSLTEIVQGTAADTMPPLYYFLLHFWLQISPELWFLRLLSVLLTLISVVLLYGLVSELAGQKAGLWAALFAAVSPMQIYHAQDLRMYALLELCQLGYAFCLVKAWKVEEINRKASPGWWTGAVLFGVAAMYTHNLAIFGLIVPNVFLLFKRDWRRQKQLILAQAGIGLLALPWLWLIPGQIAKVQQAFWTLRPGLVEIVQAVLMWFINLPLSGVWMTVGAIFSLQIFVLVLFELWRGRKSAGHSSFLLFWAFVPPLLLFVLSYILRPVFVPRGFIVSAMAFYGLAGTLAARRGVIGKWIGGMIVLAAAMTLPFFYSFAEFPRSPFKAASLDLEQRLAPGEVIVHDNKLSFFPSHYFTPAIPQHFLADEPGSSNDTYAPASQQAMQIFPDADLETAVGDARVVYYVVFDKAINEYWTAGEEDHPSLIWLRERFRETDVRTYNDLQVIRYER
ncbi:glycosyltransferase family 39 protein [Longilinea arvoryzae]|nr:glycosyltransferase family 39 protein [Longilinea arvoryzae]